jgi:hypothetical protein
MQCSNCHFENMPGVQTCGRCGAGLLLASSVVDVHPPRASRAAKRWRRWFPITRYWNRFRAAAVGSFAGLRITGWPSDLQIPGVLLRMIVPGWAQRYAGRTARAKWLFGCYLGLLLSGLLFFGTALGWLLLGLTVSIHAASILDIVAAAVVDFRRRLIYSGIAVVLLMVVVYYPAGQLLALVATPQQFNMAAPPFEAGDVVLVNPSAYRRSDPQPGDVVHYRLPENDARVQGLGRYPTIYRLQGDRVNRILAKAGQRATCSQGSLLIDGRPSPWLPLGSQQLPDSLDITVPENCYLIFPSTDPLPPSVWHAASIVPRGQIRGHVYWRNQPLWRFGPIR